MPTHPAAMNLITPVPDPALDEDIRFSGANRDFLVVPMVPCRDECGRTFGYEPRRFFHTGKARRPAYWAVVSVESGDIYIDGHWLDPHFKTRKAATDLAQYLAKFNKTQALLIAKE